MVLPESEIIRKPFKNLRIHPISYHPGGNVRSLNPIYISILKNATLTARYG